MWYAVCSLPAVLLFPATETLSEVPALRAAGVEKGDIKVTTPRTWTWSPASPWPPVDCVKAAGLWTLPKFSEIRSRLQKLAARSKMLEYGRNAKHLVPSMRKGSTDGTPARALQAQDSGGRAGDGSRALNKEGTMGES